MLAKLIKQTCRNRVIARKLLNINHGVETFKDYWFQTTSTIVIERLKFFAHIFTNLVNVLTTKYLLPINKNYNAEVIYYVLSVFYCLSRIDEVGIDLIFFIPEIHVNQELRQIKDQVQKNWIWLRTHFDYQPIANQFIDMWERYDEEHSQEYVQYGL